jgi:hypothetical protein
MPMKKLFIVAIMVFSIAALSACSSGETAKNITSENKNSTTEVVPATTGPVAFADVKMGIMDATKDYKLFRFLKGEGTCLEQGFPTNLVYAAPNMIKTEDEKYVEDMTMVDFTGRISFNKLPLKSGKVACSIKTVQGVTTAQLVCTTGEGDAKKEVCTGSFKVYGEKK